jgi:predicted GIY-YIG superfamily endonuclease
MKQYYVYILASKKDGVLYVGVTSDLTKRTWEHKEGITEGFTEKYWVKKLVYFRYTLKLNRLLYERNNSKNGIGHGRWN